MMQKCAGFTLLELVVVVTLIGIMAGAVVPTFSQWRNQQNFENDTQKTIELISDVRSMALAEKDCDGEVAVNWIAKIEPSGMSILCTKENPLTEILVETFPWESNATITLEKADVLGTWTSVVPPLHIFIFPGGTQSKIGDTYTSKLARIKLNSAGAGKESTICFSQISSYPFISSGACDDD